MSNFWGAVQDSDGLFITGSAAAHIPYSGGRTRVYFLAAGVAALF